MSHFSPVQRGKSTALPAALSFALLLAWAAPGIGAPSDPLHLFVGLGTFHDDKLFRRASRHPGFAGRRSDAARTASAGLLFNKQRGRQHLKLEGKLSKVKFRHFDQLDYALEAGRDVAGMLRLNQRANLTAACLAAYGLLLALAGLWPEVRALFGRRAAIAPQAGGA